MNGMNSRGRTKARNLREFLMPGGELLTIPVLFAGLVLILNDHLMKAWWPSFLTGKLSDIAGLFLFSFVLCVLVQWARLGGRIIGRLSWAWSSRVLAPSAFSARVYLICALASAIVFTAIKVCAGARSVYVASVSTLGFGPAQVAADLSDLWALLVLPLGLLYARRLERRNRMSRPARRARHVQAARCVVTIAAGVACVATSKAPALSPSADIAARRTIQECAVKVSVSDVNEVSPGYLSTTLYVANNGEETIVLRAADWKLCILDVTVNGREFSGLPQGVVPEVEVRPECAIFCSLDFARTKPIGQRLSSAEQAALDLVIRGKDTGKTTPFQLILRRE